MTTVATELEIQQSVVPLEHIYVGDINPRKMPTDLNKDKNDPELLELAESIKSQGVLQPVLLRYSKDTAATFELIAGQRRFRASILAGKVDIPAIIKDMNDEEAREAAIVENLQRKDVHPLEEAAAFAMLAKKGVTPKQVATQVGKTERYVRVITKLDDLIPEFKKSFQTGSIEQEIALNLCRFDKKIQKTIYEKYGDTPSKWEIEHYHYRLDKAPFDKSDVTLNKAMGACTTCQFNTANTMLFQDGQVESICTKAECFIGKCNENLIRQAKVIKEDPTIIAISEDWSNPSGKMVEELKKEGVKILTRQMYDLLEIPEIPALEDFDGNNDTPEEDKKEYDDAVKEYVTDMQEYEKGAASGKYTSAILVDGNEAGAKRLIKVKKGVSTTGASSSKGTDAKAAEGKLTEDDVKAEAERIRERVKRGKELDAEKVYARILEATEKHAVRKDMKISMTKLEEAMMYHYLLDKAPHSIRTKLTSSLKFGNLSNEAYAARLMKLTTGEKAFIVRNVFLEEYRGNYPQFKQAYLRYQWAIECKDIDVKGFEGEQEEIRERRESRATERIASLKSKLKEPSKTKEKKKHGKK